MKPFCASLVAILTAGCSLPAVDPAESFATSKQMRERYHQALFENDVFHADPINMDDPHTLQVHGALINVAMIGVETEDFRALVFTFSTTTGTTNPAYRKWGYFHYSDVPYLLFGRCHLDTFITEGGVNGARALVQSIRIGGEQWRDKAERRGLAKFEFPSSEQRQRVRDLFQGLYFHPCDAPFLERTTS